MDRATRRSVLAGLGSLGFVAIGTTTGRTSAATDSQSTDSQPGEGPFTNSDELQAFVDDVMAEWIGTTTPGATVAIVSGDAPILTKGYGAADVDADGPVRADETVFRVGSVGKVVTYTAVMQAVEQGVFDLDTDVNSYLDDSAVTVPATYDDP